MIFVLFISSVAAADAYDWHIFNGHSYALTSDWRSWAEADSEAVSLGGHLVTINDDSENAWLTNTFRDTYTRSHPGDTWNNIAWIGYYSNDDGSSWQWVSGESVTYFRHDYSEWPQGGTRAYLHLAYHPSPGTWNAHYVHDTSYDVNPKGIVEVDYVVDPAADVPGGEHTDHAGDADLWLSFSPNPSRAGVRIAFAQAAPPIGSVTIYDTFGRKVCSVRINPATTPGAVFWEGCDDRGDDVAPGLYFCYVRSGAKIWAGKVVLQR